MICFPSMLAGFVCIISKCWRWAKCFKVSSSSFVPQENLESLEPPVGEPKPRWCRHHRFWLSWLTERLLCVSARHLPFLRCLFWTVCLLRSSALSRHDALLLRPGEPGARVEARRDDDAWVVIEQPAWIRTWCLDMWIFLLKTWMVTEQLNGTYTASCRTSAWMRHI